MGFTRAELDSFRGASIPDVIGPGLRMLLVGINPGLHTAAVQAPFSRRGNRFYPALYRAGITDHLIDASEGFRPGDREHLVERGLGITTLVAGATARADELSDAELVAGGAALLARLPSLHPAVVAVLGITAFRTAFGRPRATPGRQSDDLAGFELWVVPNPSGLNAHETVDTLATAYRRAAVAAGIEVFPQPPLRPAAR
ncbi:mismatch-specific DNA-glycosylase [Herbiconiux sp. 11R-BC]|uniref:mismatch-specific DNA-glycosylase n=1 Tax=Herbiconiux sp. 11R-BC TaxID=3111637 RepID=UPI003C00431B